MSTQKQKIGLKGELLITKKCYCPGCKRKKTFRRLPTNFKCADVICDFCGFLAQVKTMTVKNIDQLPKTCLGAAWKVQNKRMTAGIYFPLYLVLTSGKKTSIYYLCSDHQTPNLFVPRPPLSVNAKRAGWQGFIYEFKSLPTNAFVRIL